MLTFVLPTHNRSHTIEHAIRSIVEQAPADGVRVKVLAHHSPDATHQILDRLAIEFPIVSWRVCEAARDYSAVFREMFCEARDSEWVWTFGDDDRLLPGALDFILRSLVDKPSDLQFVHVAETRRASGGGAVHRGTLLDMCNSLGWIELTGFITGNIARGKRLWHAAQTPRWNRYAKSSFVQSAALLEEFAHDQCALFDVACVEPQRDDNGMSPDTMEKWREQNIDVRYQFAAECIEAMFEDGILTQPLETKFFRYLSYDLPGRFLSHFAADYINQGIVYDDLTWSRIEKLGLFLRDKEDARKLHEDCTAIRDLTILHSSLKTNLDTMLQRLAQIAQRRNAFPYPYPYVGQPEPSTEELPHHPV